MKLMREIMISQNWGGKRKGAGRPVQGNKKAVEDTKVARISIKHWARIKSGKYDEIIQTLYDYKLDQQQNEKSQTSPRYQKLNELLYEIEEILGSDYDSWID